MLMPVLIVSLSCTTCACDSVDAVEFWQSAALEVYDVRDKCAFGLVAMRRIAHCGSQIVEAVGCRWRIALKMVSGQQ